MVTALDTQGALLEKGLNPVALLVPLPFGSRLEILSVIFPCRTNYYSINLFSISFFSSNVAVTANMYSELREEARDHARLRNAYFEQVRVILPHVKISSTVVENEAFE